MLKNPCGMSFRGVRKPTDDEESPPAQAGRKAFVFRARFLLFAPLKVGMTAFEIVVQQPV